ncbi:MAG: hypothetical protein PHW95_03030 [Patescibacteria group bacterium]|nr:hypothetical protein [Patescibacteria group bacterium]
MHQANKQSGIVLILAVLIIGAVLVTAVVFSNLVISQIQQSRLIDQSIASYYLAESGAERALYQTRRLQAVKSADCSKIVSGSTCQNSGNNYGFCSLTNDKIACITDNQGALAVGGGWNIIVNNEKDSTVNLNVGDSFQLDLFSPYQGGDFQTNVQSFLVTSTITGGAKLYAELTNLTWLVGGTINCPLDTFVPARPAISKGQINLDSQTGYSSTGYLTKLANDPEINPNCSYVLRLSNVLDGAEPGQFTVSIYNKAIDVDPTTDKLEIPSRLVIDSQATVGRSQQSVRIKSPIRPPLSGLYDFVLFSEQEVVKN